MFRNRDYWALILGGSSGIGLATAKKLATMGLNLFIVHRDRRGAMTKIDEEFAAIRAQGVRLEAFNVNALSEEGRLEVLTSMADKMGQGKVRLLLHSIALGNLKLLAPHVKDNSKTLNQLAAALKVDAKTLQEKVDAIFVDGADELIHLATPVNYNQDNFLGEEDFNQTIQYMGTNLLLWVRELHTRHMFAPDARVLGLTSEGNEIAWRGYAAVACAKVALESVARAIAVEFAPYGIRANILQPGITDTAALNLIPGSSHMKAGARQRNPFGRLTRPEDVANVVSLMVTDEAGWINGSIIRVDGGEHISG